MIRRLSAPDMPLLTYLFISYFEIGGYYKNLSVMHVDVLMICLERTWRGGERADRPSARRHVVVRRRAK